MLRLFACAVLGLAFCTGQLLAFEVPVLVFEVPASIKKIDADKGTLVFTAGGMDRAVNVPKDVKVLDAQGQPLPDGIESKGRNQSSAMRPS